MRVLKPHCTCKELITVLMKIMRTIKTSPEQKYYGEQ